MREKQHPTESKGKIEQMDRKVKINEENNSFKEKHHVNIQSTESSF